MVVLSLLAVGCTQKAPEPPAPPFQGQVVRVVLPDSGTRLTQYVRANVADWEVATGGKVQVVSGPQAVGDVYVGELVQLGQWAAQFLPAELPLDVYEPDPNAPRDWPEAVRDHLWYWGTTRCVLPVSVRSYLLVCRTDALSDQQMRQLQTWQGLDQLLSELPGDGPKLIVPDAVRAVLLRAATYARTPESFAFFFDPWKNQILIDSPPFVRAVEEWRRVRDAVSFGDPEVFAESGAPLAIVATDAVRPLLTEDAPGNYRFFRLPGTHEYYDHSRQTWRQAGEGAQEVHFVSFFDASVIVVDDGADHLDAALSLAKQLGSPEVTLSGVIDPAITHGPFRLSHFRRTATWAAAGWSVERLGSFFAATQTVLGHRIAVEPLQVRVGEALRRSLRATLETLWSDATPAQKALQQAKQAWQQAIEQAGAEDVAEDYRRSVGLIGVTER